METIMTSKKRNKQKEVDYFHSFKHNAITFFKTIKKSNLELLVEALSMDNTNNIIVYEYLRLLKQQFPFYFKAEFPFRMNFLNQKQIKMLDSKNVFAKNDYSKCFQQLLSSLKKNTSKETFEKYFAKYKIFDSYLVEKKKDKDNNVEYIYMMISYISFIKIYILDFP